MPELWKVLNQRAVGTSHAKTGAPCQDAESIGRHIDAKGDEYLVVVCADGAGSAAHAEDGSAEACAAAQEFIAIDLRDGLPSNEAELHIIASRWLESISGAIGDLAAARGIIPRDLASTLLLAVAGPNVSIFAQVGDGAIVVSDGTACDVVFWPERGEYANQTVFVSDPASLLKAQLAIRPAVDEFSVLTDGLQSMALTYATKTAHAPFFLPMFRTLRAAEDPASLQGELRKFLESEPVNERTDDDKTLVLATRLRPPSA